MNVGNIEDYLEYYFFMQLNSLFIQIDGEVVFVYKFICDYYFMCFFEFECFVIMLFEYVKVVVIMGNGFMDLEIIKVM